MIGFNYNSLWRIALCNPHNHLLPVYTRSILKVNENASTELQVVVRSGGVAGNSDYLSFKHLGAIITKKLIFRINTLDFCSTGIGEPRLEESDTIANPNHHKPTDTLSSIDMNFFSFTSKLVFYAVGQLLMDQ